VVKKSARNSALLLACVRRAISNLYFPAFRSRLLLLLPSYGNRSECLGCFCDASGPAALFWPSALGLDPSRAPRASGYSRARYVCKTTECSESHGRDSVAHTWLFSQRVIVWVRTTASFPCYPVHSVVSTSLAAGSELETDCQLRTEPTTSSPQPHHSFGLPVTPRYRQLTRVDSSGVK
jgi:hypothetical protein